MALVRGEVVGKDWDTFQRRISIIILVPCLSMAGDFLYYYCSSFS
jgi:hypothetical protein